jgi:hypothetical protein
VHLLGRLDAADPLLGVGDELRFGDLRALLRLDHRDHALAPRLVGQPDDAAVAHGRVRQQRLLHLGRVHVETAGDDHVLGASTMKRYPSAST